MGCGLVSRGNITTKFIHSQPTCHVGTYLPTYLILHMCTAQDMKHSTEAAKQNMKNMSVNGAVQLPCRSVCSKPDRFDSGVPVSSVGSGACSVKVLEPFSAPLPTNSKSDGVCVPAFHPPILPIQPHINQGYTFLFLHGRSILCYVFAMHPQDALCRPNNQPP